MQTAEPNLKIDRNALAKAIDVYHKVGLFKNLNTDSVLDQYQRILDDAWELDGDDPPEPHRQLLTITTVSGSGVWWGHVEDFDIQSGGYAKSIKDWAKITNGVFSPTIVNEHWRSENGPIELEIEITDKSPQQILLSSEDGHRINPRVIHWLNTLINSEEKFYMSDDGGYWIAVFFLTPIQSDLLAQSLGIKFYQE